MKKFATALVVVVSLAAIGSAQAAQDCAAKRAALEKEIRIAEQYDNGAKVLGLRQALAEVNTHCTPASVEADVQKDVRKMERKLTDKEKDVQEVQDDLRKAQAKDDHEKSTKYQRKLAEKQAELSEAQQKLNQARAELSALK